MLPMNEDKFDSKHRKKQKKKQHRPGKIDPCHYRQLDTVESTRPSQVVAGSSPKRQFRYGPKVQDTLRVTVHGDR